MKAWDEVSSLVRSGLLDPVQSRRTAISPSESSFSMAPISMRSWVRRRSERRPMMPKSMKPMRFPGITSMLPGCGSAWNTPSISAMLRKASVPFWATLTLSIPAASEAGMVVGRDAVDEFLDEDALGGELPVDPGDDDVVPVGEDRRDGLAVARLVDEVELAVETGGEVAHLLPGAGSARIPATSSTTMRVAWARRRRSASMTLRRPGRRTFTTTSSPDIRRAR